MKEYKYKINGTEYKVTVGDIENHVAQVMVNGTPYKVELEEQAATPVAVNRPKPASAPRTETGSKVIATPSAAGSGIGSAVKAPLPGVVLDIKVKVGDQIKAGDTVVVLEAMKMENNIHSDKAGTVKSVEVGKGDSVLEGATLVTIG